MSELKPYIVEYVDPWDCFDRTLVKAIDIDDAWNSIKKTLQPKSIVLRVYHPIFEGEYTIE